MDTRGHHGDTPPAILLEATTVAAVAAVIGLGDVQCPTHAASSPGLPRGRDGLADNDGRAADFMAWRARRRVPSTIIEPAVVPDGGQP